MASEIVVVSDNKAAKGGHVVVRQFDQLCRHGYWIGWQRNFEHTITLAANIDPGRHPYIGFSINGQTVIRPGKGPWTKPPFWFEPCPGAPSVRYTCPVGNDYTQIRFTGTAGAPEACLWVQALFLHHGEDPDGPPHEGPWTSICLQGFDIEWPAFLIREEQACLKRLWDTLRRYVEAAEVGPLDPVAYLAGMPEHDLTLLHTAAQTLEKIDTEDQPELANALQESVVGILRSRMPVRPNQHQAP